MRKYHIQLLDADGVAITASGGVALVVEDGGEAKVATKDADGAALANPVALTNGVLEFFVADTVAEVDLYIRAPAGQFRVAKNVPASGPNSIRIATDVALHTYVIPFSSADIADATETDTGFDLPTNGAVLPEGISVDVTNAASTETISVGILSTESGGDADGFIALLSLTTAATVVAKNTVTVGSNESFLASTTLGALVNDFAVGTDVNEDTGQSSKKAHICDGTAKSISVTLTAGTAAAVGEGFIKLPVLLPIASL